MVVFVKLNLKSFRVKSLKSRSGNHAAPRDF